MKICELGILLLTAHLLSLGPRALLFMKLGPCCCCFPWLKLRKWAPAWPLPYLLLKYAGLLWPSVIKLRPFLSFAP